MHDPMTVAWEIRSPIKWKCQLFPKGYRDSLVTIWHVDPEKDGTDDSCGLFMRSRHCDQAILEKIRKRYEFDWDADYGGWFDKEGQPIFSVTGIVFNMVWLAALEHFAAACDENYGKARGKAMKYVQSRLAEIILFAENTADSLHSNVVGKYGIDLRSERIEKFAQIVYPWVCRDLRPWWKHPKFHVHHWKIQVHAIQHFKRWAFSRCSHCGKRFPWGYAPVSNQWDGPGPRWFRAEPDVYHHECSGGGIARAAVANDPGKEPPCH